jgi:hypothetical protein
MPNNDIALREKDARRLPKIDSAAQETIKQESAESYRRSIQQINRSHDSEISTALRKHD